MIAFEDFEKIEIRVGEIVEVSDFPKARKPAYKVVVDFAEGIGRKQSSVQAVNYSQDELIGMQVIAVVNFATKNIAGFLSEILILGVPGADGQLSLLTTSRPAKTGEKIY